MILFLVFQKIKEIQKVTFALLHTCTTFFGVLRGHNRKVASFAFWSTLALPNRPSRTFSYVYDVFACSESSESTFGALGLFGAVRIAMGERSADERTDGTLRPGTGWLRGGPPAKSYHVCGSASIPPPPPPFLLIFGKCSRPETVFLPKHHVFQTV